MLPRQERQDTGPDGDVVHRRSVVALRDEDLPGGVEQLRPALSFG